MNALSHSRLKEALPEVYKLAIREIEYVVFWTINRPDDTNEEELSEFLTEYWDDLVIDFNDKKVVLLCGHSIDDEYGWYYDRSRNTWSSYCY